MNPNKTIWIAGANVWNEGKFSETNIAIRNGKITESGGTLLESESPDTQIIRADGLICEIISRAKCISANLDIPTRKLSPLAAAQPLREDSLLYALCRTSIRLPTL